MNKIQNLSSNEVTAKGSRCGQPGARHRDVGKTALERVRGHLACGRWQTFQPLPKWGNIGRKRKATHSCMPGHLCSPSLSLTSEHRQVRRPACRVRGTLSKNAAHLSFPCARHSQALLRPDLPIKTGKGSEWTLLQENEQMANKHRKRGLTPPAIQGDANQNHNKRALHTHRVMRHMLTSAARIRRMWNPPASLLVGT